jgi:hypothetical protein
MGPVSGNIFLVCSHPYRHDFRPRHGGRVGGDGTAGDDGGPLDVKKVAAPEGGAKGKS